MGVKNGKVKNGKKPSPSKLQQINESPCQSESNCFFGIKSYIKDFYQKDESDQETAIKSKKTDPYSSSESEMSDVESGNRKGLIENCDKLKKKLKGKSRRKIRKFMNYSREHWNLFYTNESEEENFESKRIIDEESQRYKTKSNRWSVYAWRSIFVIGFILLGCGLLLAASFLLTEHQVEIGKQEEMAIIDRNAIKYNKMLNQIRALSLALISVGLLLFVSTLLLPALVGASCFSMSKKRKDQTFESFLNNNRSDSDEETSAKVCMKRDKSAQKQKRKKKIDEPIEDNISKIPTVQQIETVQPERVKDETFLRKN